MDPMNFENGIQPKRDLFSNAQNSPFFSQLPGELRDMIYQMLFKRSGKKVRRGLLAPSALRICRQFYAEAAAVLYADNRHKITLEPDMAIYRAAPRLPTQFISTRNISMIQHLKLELQVRREGQSGGIRMADIGSVERHLRGVCLALSSSGAVLKSLEIAVPNGFLLLPQAAFELLDGLKELRVNGQVRVLGIEDCEWQDTHELVRMMQNEMRAPDGLDGDGSSQLMIRRMCQDLWDYQNVCIEHVQDWPQGSATEDEKEAALKELRQVFEVEDESRGVMHFPVGSKPMELFRAALQSIEAIYAKIDQQRFGDYHEGVTEARERLYMRKSFREMAPHAVPNVYAFD